MARVEQRLLAKVVREGACLRWTGAHNPNGYGQMRVEGKARAVHRLAFELWNGPIPDGLEVDHVKAKGCRHRDCIEPTHLEAVTHHENLLRGGTLAATAAAKTHCVHGHEFTPENTSIGVSSGRPFRRCLTCKRQWSREHRARAKGDT